MGVIDAYFFPNVARIIVFERLIGPALFGHTPDEQRIAAVDPPSGDHETEDSHKDRKRRRRPKKFVTAFRVAGCYRQEESTP